MNKTRPLSLMNVNDMRALVLRI